MSAGVCGMANGIATTAASLGRTVAPSLFGNLYSWSLRNVKDDVLNPKALGFPFDQYLSFIVTGLVFFMCAMIALFALPPMSPSQKPLDDENRTRNTSIFTSEPNTVM